MQDTNNTVAGTLAAWIAEYLEADTHDSHTNIDALAVLEHDERTTTLAVRCRDGEYVDRFTVRVEHADDVRMGETDRTAQIDDALNR